MIKYMDIKEFRESGLLAEVNRSFFHPLGLALTVGIEKDGAEYLNGIWDCRADPEGILFTKEDFPVERIQGALQYIRKKHDERRKNLGFVYQDVDNPQ